MTSGSSTAPVAAGPVLRAQPDVAVGIGLHGVGLFVAAVCAIGLPVLLAVRLGQGAAGYGLALAAIGAGALAGNFLVGSLRAGQWLSLYCAAWVCLTCGDRQRQAPRVAEKGAWARGSFRHVRLFFVYRRISIMNWSDTRRSTLDQAWWRRRVAR